MSNDNSISVADIDIDVFPSISAVVKHIVSERLNDSTVAVAINPEKIVLSKESPKIKKLLMDCDLRYADGIGVVKAIKKKNKNIPVERIPGCELWESLMHEAGESKIPVFLLGSKEEVVNQVKEKLISQYGTHIVGCHDGYFENDEDIINSIKKSKARILTVAMGSPRQEQFMFKCKLAGVSAFMMGVGGTYDVYTGNVKRAPKWSRRIHCEWLYRLLSEPKRIFRQIKILKFVYWYMTNKL